MNKQIDKHVSEIHAFRKRRKIVKFFKGKDKTDLERYNTLSLRRAVRALEKLSRKHAAQQILDESFSE